MTTTPLLLRLSLLVLWTGRIQGQSFLDPNVFPPTCDDCHCVYGDGESCPSTLPETTFNFTAQLGAMTWKNPISLDCNPYPYTEQEGCGFTIEGKTGVPPENLGEDAVCGILLDPEDIRANQCHGSYTTRSFASSQEANDVGYQVTHTGACGACSSTRDLAIYIEKPDLQGAGQACGLKALGNETEGLECYKEIGFTDGCAAAWLYDTTNTRENCLDTCLSLVGQPPNLDQPGCPMNPCILCNEIKSGPYFKLYAARTRRGSGLLSTIVRQCSEIVTEIQPLNPCPNGYLSGMEEESYPVVEEEPEPPQASESPSGGSSLAVRVGLATTLLISTLA